jgi:hypothetical protein
VDVIAITPTPTPTSTPVPTPTSTPTPTPTPTTVPPITATVSMTPVSCNGGSDGTITVSNISGGIGGPYSVKLNSNGTYQVTTTSRTYSLLTSNYYEVYVKDSNDNQTIIGINVTQPTLNVASISVINGESLNAISIGGVWPKTYKLRKDTASPYVTGCGDTLITTINNVTESNSTQLISGLSSGYYCLEVTDANGCVVNSGLTELAPIQIDWTSTINGGTGGFSIRVNDVLVVSTDVTNSGFIYVPYNSLISAYVGAPAGGTESTFYSNIYAADQTGVIATSGPVTNNATSFIDFNVTSNTTIVGAASVNSGGGGGQTIQ